MIKGRRVKHVLGKYSDFLELKQQFHKEGKKYIEHYVLMEIQNE